MSDQNDNLSERELEILRLVATGASNKEIARQLVISPNTVKVHLRNIFAKIGVSSRTEATLHAMQIGLITPGGEAAAGGELDGETGSRNGSQAASGLKPDPVPQTFRQRIWSLRVPLVVLLAALLLIVAAAFSARFFMPVAVTPTVSSEMAPITSVQRWSTRAALPSPRKGMGIVEYEGSFYLVGGETADGIDGALLRYDPNRNNWQALKSMNEPATDIQARLLGEKIYVPGGRLPDGSTSSQLRVYDPRQDEWSLLAPLPVPLSAYAMAAFEGRLYLFGGISGSEYVKSVYVYIPEEDRWVERTPMSAPRAYAAAAVAGSKIYIIGGYDGKRALALNEAYFPNRDANGESAWETFEPMPGGRYAMGSAVLADIIYLVGGIEENGASTNQAIQQYLTKTNLWDKADVPLEAVGESPATLASGNFIYILGGQTASGLSASHQSYQALYTVAVPVITK